MESQYSSQLALPFGEKVTLLIVEDDPDTREILALFFSDRGYAIQTADTGRQAVKAINDNKDIDVVLLDIFIPDMGGLEVLADINRRASRPSVILISGLADKEAAHDALRLGAFDYILKPFNLDQVESSVVAALAHRDYVKQSWWKRVALKPAS